MALVAQRRRRRRRRLTEVATPGRLLALQLLQLLLLAVVLQVLELGDVPALALARGYTAVCESAG